MKKWNRWLAGAVAAGLFATVNAGNAGSDADEPCAVSPSGDGPVRNREMASAAELFRLHGLATGRPFAPARPLTPPGAADGGRSDGTRFEGAVIHAIWRQ
jgi:hypothetical protein